MNLQSKIDALFERRHGPRTDADLELLSEFRAALNRGAISVVEPSGQGWMINVWVKRGLLLHSIFGELRDVSEEQDGRNFDLDTMATRTLMIEDRVRVPTGGSTIRDGVYLGPDVTCMPPVFINMGASIGEGTLIDSHTMIGICTQIGRRVTVGCGTKIGGVLEPVDRLPAVIGDDVAIGSNCVLYEGPFIGDGAVLAPGTVLTAQTRIYDPFKKKIYKSEGNSPLAVPPMAVIHPGGVIANRGPAKQTPFVVNLPIVIGYLDDPELGRDVLASLMD